MTVWFVSRHPGAVEWARRQGLSVDQWVHHLSAEEVQQGDVVAGTLPVQVAAEVCRKGGRYLHLSVDLPANARGRELGADELENLGARLEDFQVQRPMTENTP
jgi:CRISPR-associated protein Csx16